ncbi:MAG: hypothetical protein U5R30_09695 [Deltaproteobacteria bacterium]|nr:hypothetical protein [Deltaproteobacteria bacterium]
MAMEIDGQMVTHDPRRAKGFHANAAMRVDPILKNTTLERCGGWQRCVLPESDQTGQGELNAADHWFESGFSWIGNFR